MRGFDGARDRLGGNGSDGDGGRQRARRDRHGPGGHRGHLIGELLHRRSHRCRRRRRGCRPSPRSDPGADHELANRNAHAVRVGKAIRLLELQSPIHDTHHLERRVRHDAGERRRGARRRANEDLVVRLPFVNGATCEQGEKDGTDRPKVRTSIDVRPPAEGLLGRHVRGRSHHHAGLRLLGAGAIAEPRDAEIEHLQLALRRDEEVVRLQIAVHHSDGVGLFEYRERLFYDGQNFGVPEPAPILLCARFDGGADEQLHDEIRLTRFGDVVVEYADRARVLDLVGDVGFAQKSRADLLMAAEVGVKDLDGRARAVPMCGGVDRRHATDANERVEPPLAAERGSHASLAQSELFVFLAHDGVRVASFLEPTIIESKSVPALGRSQKHQPPPRPSHPRNESGELRCSGMFRDFGSTGIELRLIVSVQFRSGVGSRLLPAIAYGKRTLVPIELPAVRILIVDDDKQICDYMQTLLENDGFHVKALSDPTLVEDEVRVGEYHVIILDLMMPKLDGIELLRRIRNLDKDIAVVIFTAHPNLDSAIASMKLDAVDYIKKPFNVDEFREVLSRVMRKKGLARTPEEQLHKIIGDTIRTLRKEKELTLKQMSRRTGLSISLLSQIERAESSPSISSLYKISVALDSRIQDLFGKD